MANYITLSEYLDQLPLSGIEHFASLSMRLPHLKLLHDIATRECMESQLSLLDDTDRAIVIEQLKQIAH